MKLYRQKEQLKKDILKKRIVLEKELQIEIQNEVATELSNRASDAASNRSNELDTSSPDMSAADSPSKKR